MTVMGAATRPLVYFGTDCRQTFQLLSCELTQASTEITCEGYTQGAGARHGIVVSITDNTNAVLSPAGEQQRECSHESSGLSASDLTYRTTSLSYRPPAVFQLVNPPQQGNTAGGDVVVIRGQYFGQAGSDLHVTAYYGANPGFRWPNFPGQQLKALAGTSSIEAAACVVVTDSQIICQMAPLPSWIDANGPHAWTVEVGGQVALWPRGFTSYGFPTITGLSGEGSVRANTTGSQKIVIDGRNFGPVVPDVVNYVVTVEDAGGVNSTYGGRVNVSLAQGLTMAPGPQLADGTGMIVLDPRRDCVMT